jgi:glucosyl-3-phosphoglycerate synthase
VAPELAALTQPLSGQVAVRADVARGLSFVTGYGVEIAMLIDIWRSHGMAAIVEADMGEVQNRSKPDSELEAVLDDVLDTALLRGLGSYLATTFSAVSTRFPRIERNS